MRDAEDRIAEDDAKAELRRRLAREEANFIATRLSLAAMEYPRIMRAACAFLFKPDFDVLREEILKLQAEVKAINARLDKAGNLVKAIDERTRPKTTGVRR